MSSNFDFTTLLNKNRVYLPAVSAGLITSVLLIYSFFSILTLIEKRQELQKIDSEVASLEVRVGKLRSLQEGEMDRLEEVVLDALPNEKPVFKALRAVNDLAAETEIQVSQLESRPGSVASSSAKVIVNNQSDTRADKALFQNLSINLEIEGRLDSINNFLNKLLEVAPLMELKNVRISLGGNRNSSDTQFSSEIELEVYWKPDKQQSTKTIDSNSRIEELSEKQVEIIEETDKLRRF